jgi:hypothetical protein
MNHKGFIESLHIRDEDGRVRAETVPTLVDRVQSIYEEGTNVVLQLDFKDKDAVEPAYWVLKNMTNSAGVLANEWCIYKLQSVWWQTPQEFDALDWVQDAFLSGVQLAYIPVYNPNEVDEYDQLASLKAFLQTNYTVSAEIEIYSTNGPLQNLMDYMLSSVPSNGTFQTSGIL